MERGGAGFPARKAGETCRVLLFVFFGSPVISTQRGPIMLLLQREDPPAEILRDRVQKAV